METKTRSCFRQSPMRAMGFKLTVAAMSLAIVGVALSSSVEAAERKKQTGNNKAQYFIYQTKTDVGDVPGHQLMQAVRVDQTSSADPDFNGNELRVFDQVDEVKGTGTHHGHCLSSHKSGDRIYCSYDGTHKTVMKDGGAWEMTGDGKYQWTSGTGRFKGAKGGGTYKCRFTPEGGGCDWQGEHEY